MTTAKDRLKEFAIVEPPIPEYDPYKLTLTALHADILELIGEDEERPKLVKSEGIQAAYNYIQWRNQQRAELRQKFNVYFGEDK